MSMPRAISSPWLNELAFAPVDFRDDAPIDEWSQDIGCARCISRSRRWPGWPGGRFRLRQDAVPEQLVKVQEAQKAGDPRAGAIYETIGCYFGYSIAHYADYYASTICSSSAA